MKLRGRVMDGLDPVVGKALIWHEYSDAALPERFCGIGPGPGQEGSVIDMCANCVSSLMCCTWVLYYTGAGKCEGRRRMEMESNGRRFFIFEKTA